MDGLELELNSDRHARPRAAPTWRSCAAFLDAPRRRALRADVRRLRDVNPLRAFDTKDERSRAVLADAPKITDRLSPEAARALRRACAPSSTRAASPTASSRRSCAASTTTRTRRGRSSGRRSARSRPSPAAGATTASPRSSAGRRPPASGSRAGIDRIVLALEDQGRAAALVTRDAGTLLRQITATDGAAAAARAARRGAPRRPARRGRPRRAQRQGPVEAGRPHRGAAGGGRAATDEWARAVAAAPRP